MKPLALLLAVAAVLQSPKPGAQLETAIVTVTNGAGQYVQDLKQEDFVLEENGMPQQITKFSKDPDIPISVGILIDKSTSMRLPVAVQGREKVPAALLAADGAARVVVRLSKPSDEYLVMVFDEKLSVKQPFTSDKKKVTDLLYKNNVVGGSTHLYKAIGDALKETRKKAKNRMRALIVITDVHDTSGDKIEDLKTVIREEEIPVFTFGMRWDAWGVPGEAAEIGKTTYEESVLKMMATDSGGRSVVVDIPDLLSEYTIDRMIDFVQAISVELRGQYAISYNSTAPGPSAGKAIRVRTVRPDLRVQLRRVPLDNPPVGKK
jgi:VWFA-related protein